ncbi:RTTN [Branchiostoma lanceolatum]|uniref:RTTN protein n=1 Tax=Branchiostoma lanceolatum TaxID=7740 RepID=A0A8K0AB01_BRALA|nr:RTTN [Branchiostoma lanceolatum]
MGSNKEDINLTPLLNKLGHDLEEIRVRALLNILSKLEHGHDLEEIRVRALLNILSKLEHGVVWHDLEEIRVRALLNILSKLEHGVVCEADLVQQRPLLIRLLEWFNFRSCPLQEEVLGLLNRLAQHSSAVEILVSLGAVAFLSQLRKDVSAELQPITDQTLNQLLILPRPGPEEHSRECIYQHRATKFSSPLLAESSIPPMQEDTQPKQLTAASDSLMSQQNSSLDSQHGQLLYMEPKVGYFRRDSGSTATLMANLEQEQQEQVVGTGLPSPTCLRFSTFPWLTLTPTDRHVLAATNRSLNSGNPQLVTSSCEFLSNVVFYDFPAETFLQRPAIVKTLVSLLKVPADGGHDPSQGAVLCLRNLCVHLQARLAFYQDPALYCPKQDYLSHASSTVSTEMSTPTPQSDSLHSAMEETPDRPRGDGRDRNTPSSTYELHTVVFYKLVETTDRARADGRDRNTTSSTSSPSHSVSASSVRSGSDPMEDLEPEDLLALQSSPSHSISASSVRSAGSDPMEDLEPEDLLALQSSPSHSISASSVRSAGSDPMEDLEPEDLLALQFSQLSLPQFCTTLLANGPALLKSHDPAAVTQVLELLQRATGLMEEALTPEVWEDQSTVAAELVEELIEALDNTGEVLHFHNMQSRGPRTPENEVTHHRMVYTALAILTTHLLQAFVPLEKAADILPESLGSALALLAMDPSFQTTHPAAHEVVVAYMEQTSEDDYQLYSRAQHVCASIDCSVQFVKEQNFEGGRSLQEMVELAEGALSSLPYHQHLALVSQFVRLCSDMCKPVHANPQLVQDCTRVLLKFLAHPEEAVRHTAYQTCLNTVKEVLGISRATETASLSCRSVLFLVDPHVLYQLCCFGLAENKTKVGEMAAELLLYLLQGRLIMTTAVWNKLMDALLPVLPVLQGYASVETKLGRCVLGLLRPSSEGDAGCLPKLERFRGGLRLLMSRESSMREEAAAVVSQHLALEGGRAQLLPQDAEQAILKAQDILIVRQQQQPSGENQSSIFQPEDVLKLWDLYTSPTVEGVVRRSAAQQFTTILADKLMHETFRRQGGVDVTVNYLKQAVQGDNQELEKRNLETVGGPYVEVLEKRNLVPPCLCILRLLVQEDPSLRHALRQEMPLYLTVLRCALQSLYDDRTCTEAASLLTLLLFDEVASIQTWSRDSEQPPTEHFSLPLNVVTRYRLPLKPPTHHHTSPHQPECDADPRQLQEGPPAEMLRMAWNVPWEGGMDQLAAGEQETTEGIPASLILTSRDKLLLRSTHIKTALQFNINEIEGAPSHYVAKLALMRLALLLTSDVIGNGNGTASSGSIAEILFNLDWKPVFKRFLEVMPANGEDDLLLSEVLKVLLLFLKSKEGIRDSVSSWLLDLVLTRGSPLLWLLSQGDNKEHENMVGPKVQVLTAHRTLQKQLMALLSALCNHLVHREESRAHQPMLGDLAQGFLQRLHLADPSHFYDLASLESTLHCLVHVTARPDWSTGSSTRETLCQELLETLREVVLSFHVGRGSTTRSYMGKGVIKNASISLKHLALEMAQVNTNKDWPLLWLNTKSEEGAGLDWLVPLWAYRDPEVRAAGLGIAVLLSGSEEGRIALTTGCQQVTGGIWGTSISVLLDHTECSLVRQQAAAILVNLTSQALPTTPAQANDSAWQGPSVTDEDTGFTLVGLPALLALLHHCQFYTHVSFMLGNYYPHSVIQPVSVAFRQATESQSDTGGTTSTSASQCGLQAGHRVTERHGGHHVNFSFMLGNYYPHSVIQPVSVAFRQATESQSDTGGTTSTSDHSTPTGDVGSSRSSLTSGEQYFTSTATLTTQMSATPVPQPAVVQGPVGGRASSRQSTDSTAGSTYSEPVGVDYPSVVTPDLLAALTRLVSNMVVMASHDALQSISQHNIFNSLLRFLDADILRIQLKEQRESTAKCSTVKLLLGELLHMHCSILSLMQTCVLNKPGLGKTFAQGRNNVKTVLQLLLVGRTLDKEDSMYPSCCTLWRSVYSFLSSVVQTDGRDATADITVSLANNWDTFFESVQSCLSVSAPAHLQLCTVHLLALLLAEDGQQQGKPSTGTDPAPSLSLLLDRARVKDADDEIEKTEPVSCGSALCLCLVQLYDSMGSRDSNMDSNMDSNLDSNTSHMDSRAAVGNSLALLLAHSKTAKHTALQSGFVDSTLEHMKDLHAQMNLDSLNTGKPAARRKDDPAVTDLLLSLHLLRNFMLKYQDGKAAAVEAGLSQVVHKLWSWAMTNHTLMSAMLGLLATYTAQCAKACSSLAASGRAGVKTSHEGSAGSSVVHSLVKMATKQTTQGSRAHLKTVFAVLANLALSNVCRGILWKSNFLQGFSAVVPGKGGKDKKQNSLAARWLAVLVNVSFSLDGQQMLIKISDMLGLLVEHVQSSPRSCQTLALLVLRNMCFHPANKPRMVAHEKVVETLLRCMETGSLHSKVVASSALWALVTNCQKGKVGLKNAAVVHRLEESWQAIRRDPPTSSKEQKLVQQCLYNMKTIVSVVRS